MLGDDFLSGLSLPTMPCLVGCNESKNTNLPSTVSHVERLHLFPNEPQMMGLASETTVQQIRILTEVSIVTLITYCTCHFTIMYNYTYVVMCGRIENTATNNLGKIHAVRAISTSCGKTGQKQV